MMIQRLASSLLAVLLAGALGSCGNRSNLESDQQKLDSLLQQDSMREQMNEFVHIFPSQIKVARLFKNAGLKYQASDLVPTESANHLVKEDEKAFAMGFFGVDMVYSALNNHTQEAMTYLRISSKIAEDLGLAAVYAEKDYVRKFESNLNNQDTLESLIRDLFAETDAFLKDNQKLDMTLLTFAGGWTESVYLAARYAQATNNQAIVQLIGEQLVSLEPLIGLVESVKMPAGTEKLIAELKEVQAAIKAGIKTEETDSDPMVMEMDKDKIQVLITKIEVLRSRIAKQVK